LEELATPIIRIEAISTLKVKAVYSCDMMVTAHRTTQYHNPEEHKNKYIAIQ
jgi:hypothetical protein